MALQRSFLRLVYFFLCVNANRGMIIQTIAILCLGFFTFFKVFKGF